MEYPQRRGLLSPAALAGLVVVLSLMAAPVLAKGKGAKAGGEILAKVGPYTLTLEEFNQQVNSLPPQMKVAVLHNPKLKKMFLDRWVQLTLLGMKAREMGLDKDPDVKRRISNLENTLLAQELYRRKIKGQGSGISDKEIEAYYRAHKSEFSSPEMVRARHILIRVKDSKSKKEWADARKKAMEIKAKLDKGADFAEMARKYSQDPGSRERGGDLGYFSRGKMIKPFEEAAFSLKKGEISGPVKTPFGYHLIELEDRKPASVKGLDQVKEQVRQKLLKEKEQEALQEMIARLRKQYKVEVNEKLLEEPGEAPSPHGHMGMR